MKIQQTKTGKLHLASNANITKCTVGKKTPGGRAIEHDGIISADIALDIPEDKFCKKCFGRKPKTIVTQMTTAKDETVTIPENKPEPVRRKVIIDGSRTHINGIESMIETLDGIAGNKSNSMYKRSKASFYSEALKAVRDMIKTNNPAVMERIMNYF